MDFASLDLPEPVMQGIREAGFVTATPIQEAALPLALRGKDVAGQSQTGTGKTAAFLIAAFTKLLRTPAPAAPPGTGAPRMLVIAPTRELVVQIESDAKLLGRYTPFRTLAVYGGGLIAGGDFSSVGGAGAKCIARWDGTRWQALGTGMNSYVYALSVYNGELIAGGGFASAGSVSASGIAAWDGDGMPLGRVPQIAVSELRARLAEADGLQVVDVRRPAEYRSGHVPESVSIPLDSLERNLGSLDPRRETAVICASGYRSSAATSLLRRRGFEAIFNVVGGTGAWLAAGYPCEPPQPR